MVRVKVIFKAVGGLTEAAKPVIIDNYYIFLTKRYLFSCSSISCSIVTQRYHFLGNPPSKKKDRKEDSETSPKIACRTPTRRKISDSVR